MASEGHRPALPRALRAEVEAWVDGDLDAQAREAMVALLAAGDAEALRACMQPPLRFGTAGLRGLLGPGPARMNRTVVARTTAGLCARLRAVLPGAPTRGLCIGYDARHGSLGFARIAAEVALGAGFHVHLFAAPAPTPTLAFAVLELGAAGGVMVTASHNPPAYNGFKVYDTDGAQICAPTDAQIATAIEASGPARALPRAQLDRAREAGQLREVGDDLLTRYLAATLEACPAAAPGAGRGAGSAFGIAYTALHGVGNTLALRALSEAGFAPVSSEPSQAMPDPDFPTVAFPNPEEPGAMDAVLALAEREGHALALANDPDADRLAVAARDAAGELRRFNGNQVGVLLADDLLTHTPSEQERLVVTTIVSTAMLAPLAAAHGARCETSLTGFKWIMRCAASAGASGARFVFGFEEALGYAAGSRVRDKDGILAALLVCRLARDCAARGETLWDRLGALYRQHGYHLSSQYAAHLPGADGQARITGAVERWRENPPRVLGPHPLHAVTDHQRSMRRCDGRDETTGLPSTNAIVLELRGGHRVCLRPSGTEPKLKLYLEAVTPPGEDLAAMEARATADLQLLKAAALESLGLD